MSISQQDYELYKECLRNYQMIAAPIFAHIEMIHSQAVFYYIKPYEGTMTIEKKFSEEQQKALEGAKETLASLAELCFEPYKRRFP